MNHLNVHTVAEQLATDDEQLTEPMREEAFSLQVMRFAPGDEDPMHAHDEEEIYLALTEDSETAISLQKVSGGAVQHTERVFSTRLAFVSTRIK